MDEMKCLFTCIVAEVHLRKTELALHLFHESNHISNHHLILTVLKSDIYCHKYALGIHIKSDSQITYTQNIIYIQTAICIMIKEPFLHTLNYDTFYI